MIRVIVADDSATARHLLRAILEHDGDIAVIAEAHDGREAVDLVEQKRPDLVIMDVHMPVADGLQATKEIMMRSPTPILIVSAATQRDVDLSLSATQAGALMALPKPESPAAASFPQRAAELRSMARAMSQVKVVRHWSVGERPAPTARVPRPRDVPAVLAMAASTGGPAAIRRVLMDLPATWPLPILLVQHIARDFTTAFADWLSASCALHVKIASDREFLRPGVVYVAPDDMHLGVTEDGRVQLSNDPPMGGFRPSATHLFASVGRVFRSRMIGVVLTGMGADGAEGLASARAAGAYVIAQDEASSIVYGMAAEAVRRGAVDAVMPVDHIAVRLIELAKNADHGS